MDDCTKQERLLASVNVSLALREFTFDKNKFEPAPGDENELADGVLWLEDRLIVFQAKERNAESPHDAPAIEKWFKEAIVKELARFATLMTT